MNGRVEFYSYPITAHGASKHVLHCVDSYKHVGSTLSSTAVVHPEIKVRMNYMSSSVKPLRKTILKKPYLPASVKATYAGAYLFSK
eukprot:2537458-Karenia_brevis.AAC.1